MFTAYRFLVLGLFLLGCESETEIVTVSGGGLACWDLSGDGVADADEDANADGVWDAWDCQGELGESGQAGSDGIDGVDGLDGGDGADGAHGLSCWDVSGDGVADEDEDINGDGYWDALDCQGAESSVLTKSVIYAVNGTSGLSSTASCSDNDDILLNGGCSFQEGCIPAHFTGIPINNDDSGQPSGWYCQLNCGSVTASGFCLIVE